MSKGSKPAAKPKPRSATPSTTAAPVKRSRSAPRAIWLMTAEPGSALEAAVFSLWRAARARGWEVSVALPLRRTGAFGAPQEVLERWPIDLELGPGEFHGEARRTAAAADAADRLVWLVPQSADLSPAFTSAFVCAAALDLARRDGHRVVHCFGLRGSLAPVLLSTRLGADPRFDALRSVLGVDQVEDLGTIDAATLHDLGLPAGLLEDPVGGVDGRFAALKAGVVFADRVVLPTARLRRALLDSPAGRAASERGRDLVTIPWAGEASTAADPDGTALEKVATLYRGLLRNAPRRVEVVVPPRAAVEAPDAAPATPPAEPFIDWGPALPERYGEDICELLVQSPRSLYAYWEVSPETQRLAGGDLYLRLRSRAGERVLGVAPGAIGDWWMEAEPGEVYVLDIASEDGRALLRSAPARTPHATPSAESDIRMVHRDRVRGARPGAPPMLDPSARSAPRLPPLPAPAIAPEPDPAAVSAPPPRSRGGDEVGGVTMAESVEREAAPTWSRAVDGSVGSARAEAAEADTGTRPTSRRPGSSEQRPRRSS